MYRDENGWIGVYERADALWIYSGNALDPHAELTSKNHSNGFFNSHRIIPNRETMSFGEYVFYVRQLRQAASDLVEHFQHAGGNIYTVDRVVGPATGATRLAEYISDEVASRRGSHCAWASPEKDVIGGKKVMIFKDPTRLVLSGEVVLLIDDVCTTAGSALLTADAVKRRGGNILPQLLVLVNRSGLAEVGGHKIIALINHSMPIWTPEECLLCKQGSKAIRPKDKDHWAELTTRN